MTSQSHSIQYRVDGGQGAGGRESGSTGAVDAWLAV